MKPRVLASLVILLGIITLVQSCLFQLIGNKKAQDMQSGVEHQKNKNYVRPLYKKNSSDPLTSIYNKERNETDEHCVCGHTGVIHRINKWVVNVTFPKLHAYIQNDTFPLPQVETERRCMGTIIAHNLIVTSQKCLAPEGAHVLPYEAWPVRPKYRDSMMVNISSVHISEREYTLSQENFTVEDIIYNFDQYSVDGGKDIAWANDIAIIVVKGDLFHFARLQSRAFDISPAFRYKVDYAFLPVCIPEKSSTTQLSEDIIHKYGYTYGLGGDLRDDPTPEFRAANELVILDGRECDKELNLSDFSTPGTLCVRNRTSLPTQEGGPLLTTNTSGYFMPFEIKRSEHINYYEFFRIFPQTAFLLGIGTVTGRHHPENRMIHYTYFANVLQNRDFIYRVAEEYSSKWCVTPKFNDTKKASKPSELDVKWSWETKKIKPRSETLDCACGLRNSNKSETVSYANRTIPPAHEFGWLARFIVNYRPKMDGLRFPCAATIINDRVLLTCARCIVGDGTLFAEKDEEDGVEAGYPYQHITSQRLSIRSHYESVEEDPTYMIVLEVKEYIVHPDYIPNSKNGQSSYDLALIILKEPLKFATATTQANVKERDIRPVCLPKTGQKIDLTDGTMITALNYDIETNNNGVQPSKNLIPVRSLNHCAHNFYDIVPDTVFCTDHYAAPIQRPGHMFDFSTGGTGAPVTFRKTNGQHFEVGVFSTGRTDNAWNRPLEVDLHIDIQQFIPFIEYYSNLHGAQWCKL